MALAKSLTVYQTHESRGLNSTPCSHSMPSVVPHSLPMFHWPHSLLMLSAHSLTSTPTRALTWPSMPVASCCPKYAEDLHRQRSGLQDECTASGISRDIAGFNATPESSSPEHGKYRSKEVAQHPTREGKKLCSG